MVTGAPHQPLGQLFQKMRTTQRVNDMRHIGLALKMKLGVAGNAGGMVGRQAKRLVKRVGVERLGMASDSGACLDTGAGDIVEHILRRQRPARSLAVSAQHQ